MVRSGYRLGRGLLERFPIQFCAVPIWVDVSASELRAIRAAKRNAHIRMVLTLGKEYSLMAALLHQVKCRRVLHDEM